MVCYEGSYIGYVRSLVIVGVEYEDPLDLMDHPSNMAICLCCNQKVPNNMWTYNLIDELMIALETISKGKIPCTTSPSPFFEKLMGGWVEKRVVPCAHARTGTPHGWVSRIVHYARTGRLSNQEKDMCRLESYGDWIGRSPLVHPWVLKAILFFKTIICKSNVKRLMMMTFITCPLHKV